MLGIFFVIRLLLSWGHPQQQMSRQEETSENIGL